jgi:hypothetical protein
LKPFHEWREGGKKESGGGVNSNLIYSIHCKSFCKCHNVLPLSTTTEKKKKEFTGYISLKNGNSSITHLSI